MTDLGDELEQLVLSDGRRIVMVQPPSGRAMVVRLLGPDSAILDEARIPYPSAGFGGHRFALSPTEHVVVFAYFSGQSEEAYSAFRVSDRLTEVGAIPYEFGECASYGFSEDERILVMGLPFSCVYWWDHMDEAIVDEHGTRRLGFGQLRLHDLTTGEISLHEIRVVIPHGWEPDEEQYDPYLRPRFTSAAELALSFPWGEERLGLPLPRVVELRVR